MPNSSSEEKLNAIKSAFEYFDKDRSGHIDLEELSHTMDRLGYDLSYEEVAQILSRFDADNNGQISFDEFAQFIGSL